MLVDSLLKNPVNQFMKWTCYLDMKMMSTMCNSGFFLLVFFPIYSSLFEFCVLSELLINDVFLLSVVVPFHLDLYQVILLRKIISPNSKTHG